jgi:GAF domain-containing protein
MALTEPARLESDTLYDVVGVIASTPQLEPVLDGIVGVLTRATGCHACFVYLVDRDELVMRAASPVYAHLAGRIRFPSTEGLVGWVVQRNTPAFIRDNAQDDPRTNFVPELEEERFQSMVAVPIPARDRRVLGAVVLHTVAPREFDEQTLNVLGHTASMIAGAIENAQLYEQAEARVAALTALTDLTERISAAGSKPEIVAAAQDALPALVGADAARIHEPDDGDDGGPALLMELLHTRHGEAIPAPLRERLALPPDTVDLLATPLTSGTEHHGLLVVTAAHRFSPEAAKLVGAVANHLALALNKAELIDRLTADTAVRDLFAALDEGLHGEAAAKADLLRLATGDPVVAFEADLASARETALAERLEALLRRWCRRVVAEISHTRWRALATVRPEALPALDTALRELAEAEHLVLGRSTPRENADDAAAALREAATAARAGHVLSGDGAFAAFDALGVYRYLVHVSDEELRNDTAVTAVRALQDYDRRRGSTLVRTLEQYLANGRAIAETARALTVHPNTLRQRLDRVEKLTGLALADTDLLELEIAIKLARLR